MRSYEINYLVYANDDFIAGFYLYGEAESYADEYDSRPDVLVEIYDIKADRVVAEKRGTNWKRF